MSILTLYSHNPDFSYVIEKNPATIDESGKAFRRELRKGVVYGWFPKAKLRLDGLTPVGMFRLWFKDHETQSSFAQGAREEFEYLDCSRYGSPYVPIQMIGTALASASKRRHEKDVDTTGGSAATTCIRVSNLRYLEQLKVHYKNLGIADIQYHQLQGKYYSVIVLANNIYETLNVLQVVCLLQCLCDEDVYVRMDTSSVEKYIRCLNAAKAPYYVRYLFQMKAISNYAQFDKVKAELEGEGMKLCFGDTRQQRFDAIKKELTGGISLLDIGAGELFQSLRLSQKYEVIFAVEADEDRNQNNEGKINSRGLVDKISAMHAYADEDWVNEHDSMFVGSDVLMTEILEHIPEGEALDLLEAILRTDFNKVVVTVPNADFNKHYAIGEGLFRHDDHKWEPTFSEFCDIAATLAAKVDLDVTVTGIGDDVNDCCTSTMAVFTRKKENATSDKDGRKDQ